MRQRTEASLRPLPCSEGSCSDARRRFEYHNHSMSSRIKNHNAHPQTAACLKRCSLRQNLFDHVNPSNLQLRMPRRPTVSQYYNTKRIKMHSIKKRGGLLRTDNFFCGRQSPDGDAEYDIKYRKKSQFIFKWSRKPIVKSKPQLV